MGIWEDTFGEGSCFRRVFWRAPFISLAVLSVIISLVLSGGSPFALIAGPVVAFLVGLVFVALNYLAATIPAVAVWFIVFRVARQLGLERENAALMAAPAMAMISSLIFIAIVSIVGPGTGNELLEGRWGELLPATLVLAGVSMVVSFLVAQGGSRSGRKPPPRPYIQQFEPRQSAWADPDSDDRVRRTAAVMDQGAQV